MAGSTNQNTAKMTTKEKKMARKNLEKERSAKRRQEAQHKSASINKTTSVVQSVSYTSVEKDMNVKMTSESNGTNKKTTDARLTTGTTESASAQGLVMFHHSDSEPESDSYSSSNGSTTPSELGCPEICAENHEPAECVNGTSVYIARETIAPANSNKEVESDTDPCEIFQPATVFISKTGSSVVDPQAAEEPSNPAQVIKKKGAVSAFAKTSSGGGKMSAKEVKAARKKMDKGGGKTRSKLYKLLEATAKTSLHVAPVTEATGHPPIEKSPAQLEAKMNEQHDHGVQILIADPDIKLGAVDYEAPHPQQDVANHNDQQKEAIDATSKDNELMDTTNTEEFTLINEKVRELQATFPDLDRKVVLPFTARRRNSISCSNTNIAQEIIDTMQIQKGSLQMGGNLIDEFLEDVMAPSSPFSYHETDMPTRWEGMLTSESGIIDHEYRGPLQVYQRSGSSGVGKFSPIQAHYDVTRGFLAVAALRLDHRASCSTKDDSQLSDELKTIQKVDTRKSKGSWEPVLVGDPAIITCKNHSPQVMTVDPIFRDPAVISCKSSPTQTPKPALGDKAVLDDPAVTFAKSVSLGVEKMTAISTEPQTLPLKSEFEWPFNDFQGSHQSLLFNEPGHTPLEIAYYQNNIHEPVFWGMVPHPHLPCTYVCGMMGWGYYVLPASCGPPPSSEYYRHSGFIDATWCHESMLGVAAY